MRRARGGDEIKKKGINIGMCDSTSKKKKKNSGATILIILCMKYILIRHTHSRHHHVRLEYYSKVSSRE